jgi:hypothetical protein
MEKVKSIEDFLLEKINAKYAQRIFQQLNTEHGKKYVDLGKDPDYREYEWMVKRAMEIHKQLNFVPEEKKE